MRRGKAKTSAFKILDEWRGVRGERMQKNRWKKNGGF
jgi:hypothetical protein